MWLWWDWEDGRMRKTFSFLTFRELVSFLLSAIEEAKIKASWLRKAVGTLITINKVFVLLTFFSVAFGRVFFSHRRFIWRENTNFYQCNFNVGWNVLIKNNVLCCLYFCFGAKEKKKPNEYLSKYTFSHPEWKTLIRETCESFPKTIIKLAKLKHISHQTLHTTSVYYLNLYNRQKRSFLSTISSGNYIHVEL